MKQIETCFWFLSVIFDVNVGPIKLVKTQYASKMIKKVLQLAIFTVIFIAVTAYQELGMLADNGEQPAPYFSLPTLENEHKKVSLSEFEGQQTVVYFFAPWCSICKFSMPNLDKLHEQQKLSAIAIALDYNSIEEVEAFTQDLDLSMPVLIGNHQIAANFKVKAYPTYYVIDENLIITERSVGYSTELGLRARL